jgi:DNA-binding MarR family transcriptional regulator
MTAKHLRFFFDAQRALMLATRRFDAELGGVHGLGLSDLQLLYALEQAPEGRLRRVDLARRLGLTASAITWLLRPLQKRRIVASEASDEDARIAYAMLTEAGRRLLREALPTARRLAEEMLAPHLDGADLARAANLFGP